MDLLSLVSQTTKRKEDFLSEAEDLAKKLKTQEKLRVKMKGNSLTLVKTLKEKQVKWDEYAKALVRNTLVSALASVYLGSEGLNPKKRVGEAWPIIIGNMLPPLIKFLTETKYRVDKGILLIGDQTEDFSEFFNFVSKVPPIGDVSEDIPDEELEEDIDIDFDPEEEDQDRKKGKTWFGLYGRVQRYLVTPIYAYAALGLFLTRRSQGYKEMRRVARKDKRTCDDCKNFAKLEWQPIGSLPMPGQKCTCYDRCRCIIEYR